MYRPANIKRITDFSFHILFKLLVFTRVNWNILYALNTPANFNEHSYTSVNLKHNIENFKLKIFYRDKVFRIQLCKSYVRSNNMTISLCMLFHYCIESHRV